MWPQAVTGNGSSTSGPDNTTSGHPCPPKPPPSGQSGPPPTGPTSAGRSIPNCPSNVLPSASTQPTTSSTRSSAHDLSSWQLKGRRRASCRRRSWPVFNCRGQKNPPGNPARSQRVCHVPPPATPSMGRLASICRVQTPRPARKLGSRVTSQHRCPVLPLCNDRHAQRVNP